MGSITKNRSSAADSKSKINLPEQPAVCLEIETSKISDSSLCRVNTINSRGHGIQPHTDVGTSASVNIGMMYAWEDSGL
jgi:hypothetical protein